MRKSSFIMYSDWIDMIRAMDDKSRSDLLLAIMCYQNDEELPEMDYGSKIAFAHMKPMFDRDRENYDEIVEKRKESGKKGGQASAKQNQASAKQNQASAKQNQASAKQVVSKPEQNQPDNDNDNVNDLKETPLKGSKEKKRFAPPTPDDVREYCRDKSYDVNADRFVDYYASNGWMVGKAHMKDWKATVRNWARSQEQEKTAKAQRQEKTAKPNKFLNFEQRDTDYDSLVMQSTLNWLKEGDGE